MWTSDLNVQPMEWRPQNVGLPHTTHGTSTLNHLTPTSSPWNEDPKLSNSHVQPMEQRPQTVWLSHPTHGMKASNHPTLMSNPWNEGFKPSDSHVQPMEQRPQTIWLPCTTHGTKTSNRHLIPMERRLQTVWLPRTTHGTSNLAKWWQAPSVPSHYITVHSSSVLTCTMCVQYGRSYKCAPSPTLPNDDRHNDAKHDLLAIKVLTSSGVSAMKSDGKWINNAHYLSCI